MVKYVKEQRFALGIPSELSFVIRIDIHYTVGFGSRGAEGCFDGKGFCAYTTLTS
jgi:hypothetical protein